MEPHDEGGFEPEGVGAEGLNGPAVGSANLQSVFEKLGAEPSFKAVEEPAVGRQEPVDNVLKLQKNDERKSLIDKGAGA